MNKSVTWKFNLLQSLIIHTLSSGYLISIGIPLHAIRKSRGWKSLDRRMLGEALRSSQLSSPPSTLDIQTVDQVFDPTMNKLIDTMLQFR